MGALKKKLEQAELLEWAWAIDEHLRFHRAYEAHLIDEGFSPESIAWFRKEYSLSGQYNAKLAPKDPKKRNEVGKKVSEIWNNADVGTVTCPRMASDLVKDVVKETQKVMADGGETGPALRVAVVKALSLRSLKLPPPHFQFPMFDKFSRKGLGTWIGGPDAPPVTPELFFGVFHTRFEAQGKQKLDDAVRILGRSAVHPLRALDKYLWLIGHDQATRNLLCHSLYDPDA